MILSPIHIYIYIYILIYPCISNKFQRSYEIFFSHANFFRIQINFVFFRLSLYIYCLVTRICGTKVADEKHVECFWSTKCNPLHKFSFDIYVTFSNCSVDKTERNSNGRAKGKDNEYTKVCAGIRVCVRIQRYLREGHRLILYTLKSVCIFSILFPIHFPGTDKEILQNNQELLYLLIISIILVTLMFDSGVKL